MTLVAEGRTTGSEATTPSWKERRRSGMTCRFCGHTADHLFVDLGMSPLCESFLTAEQLNQMEPFYPLRVNVCPGCFLVQLAEYVSPAHIFSEYAYFSSYSSTWVEHARVYTETDSTAPAPDGEELRHRDREQRRVPAPALRRRRAFRFSASNRPRTSRRLRGRSTFRPGPASSARTPHGSWPPRANRPICSSATTCWRTFRI